MSAVSNAISEPAAPIAMPSLNGLSNFRGDSAYVPLPGCLLFNSAFILIAYYSYHDQPLDYCLF